VGGGITVKVNAVEVWAMPSETVTVIVHEAVLIIPEAGVSEIVLEEPLPPSVMLPLATTF